MRIENPRPFTGNKCKLNRQQFASVEMPFGEEDLVLDKIGGTVELRKPQTSIVRRVQPLISRNDSALQNQP